MTQKENESKKGIDPLELSRIMSKVAEKSQGIVNGFLSKQGTADAMGMADPGSVGKAFFDLTTAMMKNPMKLVEAQLSFWNSYMALWQNAANRMINKETKPVAVPERGDKRFKHEDWQENPVFDFIKQSYLVAARSVHSAVKSVEGLDDKTAQKVDFYTRQFIDAVAPSNFMATNPEVWRTTMETRGENLVKGLSNMLDDLERGKGRLNIKMTDMEAFQLGENIAVTPGKVIFQNDMMQLIQYEPSTKDVYKRPLMIIPPWINKFYILDLRPKNSMIKWLVDQGHTVFLMSWKNPDESSADKDFQNYMLEGPLESLDIIEKVTGVKVVNVIGYCLGGTLLSSTLAYMAAKQDDRIASATFFTTMIDFSEPGELGVFIDDEQIKALEKRMGDKGYLEGTGMAETFSMLRANDLIWSFVVNNYLLGKEPFPFDLLYWNSDSTRMPAKMHNFYLRNMYEKNLLKEPGGITLDGVPIDLSKVETPCYFISAREDHIAPWKSTYAGTQLMSGPIRFVLGMSGHIAGIINPPAANKYAHWTNSNTPADPCEWLNNAKQNEGSWWPDWHNWASAFDRQKVPAREPGGGKMAILEDAPGSYVKVRSA